MSSLTDTEQLDNAKSFAKKYGSSIITGILIALIAFFGWQYWQKRGAGKEQKHTAQVQQLMDDARSAGTDANAFNSLSATANKITEKSPDSVHAIQSQFVIAKLAYDKGDYAAAENALKKVATSSIKDEGLLSLVKIRLADAELAQNKNDAALKTLAEVTDPAFKATVEEAKGDAYVAKNDIENAKKAYQSAWNAVLERKQDRQILQIKLESVGILVDDPDFERPVIQTQVDES
ncbi:YfgM family protein [Acinetobacter gerneri]|jgi:predicted negative regulator of RcsB-dependent stress response|uniref:YfgM family protein n=1 Tax=Acinetobacter gerneri TaxID=202952 RepID=UPI0023F42299|nr:tetratricopeptide repeat protein [Acinetobacter gerneri]MCH4243129.1 tetratricopeptide repeat protein [Acinetobacter gerneri]